MTGVAIGALLRGAAINVHPHGFYLLALNSDQHCGQEPLHDAAGAVPWLCAR